MNTRLTFIKKFISLSTFVIISLLSSHCSFREKAISTQAVFTLPAPSNHSRPLANFACLNVWGPDGRWNSSIKTMTRENRDLSVTFTIPYLWVGRKYTFRILGFSSNPSTDSKYTCPTAPSSTDFTELGILENYLITKDTAQVLISAHQILFDEKLCGTTGKSCYDNTFIANSGGTAKLQNGTAIEYVQAGNSFEIWRETNGLRRILKATGLWASDADWQRKLTKKGYAVGTEYFTEEAKLSGRANPDNVFITPSEMRRTNHWVYFYKTSSSTNLNAAAGIEAEDWLTEWNRALTGNSSNQSWY